MLLKKYKKGLFIFIVLIGSVSFSNDKSLPILTINRRHYVSLYRLINKFNFESTYDILTGRGNIYHKSHHVVYAVGISYISINGRLFLSPFPVKKTAKEIYLPIDSAKKIMEAVFENSTCLITANRLVIKYKNRKPDIIESKNRKYKIDFIIIDAGHGGKDPGAIGPGGLREKNITLKVARYLESSLRKRLRGIRIKLTRRSDKFIELSKRTEIANDYLKKDNNGIFISIHVNASISSRTSGFETYFLSQNPSNEEARNTAALENNVIILESKKKKKSLYGDIDYIEARMYTTQIQKESSMLAKSVQRNMARYIKNFTNRGIRKADFFVLRGALMPAALVEIGFITNRKEVRYLKKRSYQKKIAKGISDGVITFIKQYNRLIRK